MGLWCLGPHLLRGQISGGSEAILKDSVMCLAFQGAGVWNPTLICCFASASPPWKGCFPLIKEKAAPFVLAPSNLTVSLIQRLTVFLGSWRVQWFGIKLEFLLEVPNWKSNDFTQHWRRPESGASLGKWILNIAGNSSWRLMRWNPMLFEGDVDKSLYYSVPMQGPDICFRFLLVISTEDRKQFPANPGRQE